MIRENAMCSLKIARHIRDIYIRVVESFALACEEHMCYVCVLLYVLSHTGYHKIYHNTE